MTSWRQKKTKREVKTRVCNVGKILFYCNSTLSLTASVFLCSHPAKRRQFTFLKLKEKLRVSLTEIVLLLFVQNVFFFSKFWAHFFPLHFCSSKNEGLVDDFLDVSSFFGARLFVVHTCRSLVRSKLQPP